MFYVTNYEGSGLGLQKKTFALHCFLSLHYDIDQSIFVLNEQLFYKTFLYYFTRFYKFLNFTFCISEVL